MGLADLNGVKIWQMTKDPEAEPIEDPIVKSDEPIVLEPIPVHKGRRLDVDDILTRSLPNVSQPTRLTRVKK